MDKIVKKCIRELESISCFSNKDVLFFFHIKERMKMLEKKRDEEFNQYFYAKMGRFLNKDIPLRTKAGEVGRFSEGAIGSALTFLRTIAKLDETDFLEVGSND